MGLVIRLVELLVVLVPLVGVFLAGRKAWTAARDRGPEPEPVVAPAAPAEVNTAARWQAIARAVKEQDRVDTRWLEYELDVAKLLDFPLMTDMREPLVVEFHRARVRADLLRPAKAEDLLDDKTAADDYLNAVGDYVTAFDVAEAEAIRRRRNDFTAEQSTRIARAQSLLRVALDGAATPGERDRAYAVATRELDGLLVLPERTRAAIERGIAGELGS